MTGERLASAIGLAVSKVKEEIRSIYMMYSFSADFVHHGAVFTASWENFLPKVRSAKITYS